MIPSISWKNIWRNKARSLIVITAVTIGLFGGLFGSAMMIGMSERRVDEALNKEISHIQLHNPKYLENPEVGLVIDSAGEKLDFIESLPNVKAASKRIKITSMINSSTNNSGVTILGIDPASEMRLTEIHQAVYDSLQVVEKLAITDPERISVFLEDSVGNYIDSDGRNPILIGEELARKLKIKVRSKVVLTFQGMDGGLHGGAFRVCGIYRTENSAFESSNAFVRITDLSRLIDGDQDLCHEIAVMMDNLESVPLMVETLREKFPRLEVRGWKEIQPEIAMLNDMMTVSTAIIMVIILLALGFGIVNTMLMVVLERTKEIGMLIAVGMGKVRVFIMIILESVLLSLTGAGIGMSIAAIVIGILGQKGLDLTAFAQEGFEAMGYGAVFYPRMGIDLYIIVSLMVIVTAILSSVYPAWKALRMNPAEALRIE